MTTDTDLSAPDTHQADGLVITTEGGRSTFGRIAAISGVLFAVGVIASMVLVGEMPGAGDDATTIREYFTGNEGPHGAGLVVVGLAIVPLLLFAAGLVQSRRRTDPADDGWATAVGAFFVFAAALHSVGVILDAGLFMSRDAGIGDDVLLALWDVSMASTAMMILGFGGAAICAVDPRADPAQRAGVVRLAGRGRRDQ